jgi:hypothetical protein
MIHHAANRGRVLVRRDSGTWVQAFLIRWPKPGAGTRARVEYLTGKRATVACEDIVEIRPGEHTL